MTTPMNPNDDDVKAAREYAEDKDGPNDGYHAGFHAEYEAFLAGLLAERARWNEQLRKEIKDRIAEAVKAEQANIRRQIEQVRTHMLQKDDLNLIAYTNTLGDIMRRLNPKEPT